ncbi:Cell division protein FtsK [Clostridiaceae bacterium JG1575]|nr:Cell division protein FtsK [Clostridiaceae bacterium JG1575]
MNDFQMQFDRLLGNVPRVLLAILLIIIAFLLATYVRNLIKKGLTKWYASKKKSLNEPPREDTLSMLSNIGYLIVLLLFLPGVLDLLGLQSISLPVTSMLQGVLGFIPNLIGAVLILVIGIFLANLIRDLLQSFLRRLNIDRFQEKLGPKQAAAKTVSFSQMLATLAYVLILIPVIIAALNALNISVISQPAVAMLNTIFLMIPRLLAAVLILIIGFYLARLVAEFLYSLIQGSGLSDRVADLTKDVTAYRLDLARILSEIVRWVILAGFLVQAFQVLQLEIFNLMGTAILAFIPRILAAAIILLVAYLLASIAKNLILRHFKESSLFAMITYGAILFVGLLAALTQIGIAPEFLLPLFQFSIAGLAVAFALAFGLGGREFAKRTLMGLEEHMAKQEDALKEAGARMHQEEVEKKAAYERAKEEARAAYHTRAASNNVKKDGSQGRESTSPMDHAWAPPRPETPHRVTPSAPSEGAPSPYLNNQKEGPTPKEDSLPKVDPTSPSEPPRH